MTSEPDSFWTELSLRVLPRASEAVGELLQDITGSGVTIEPPIQALGPDEGYVLDEEAPLTFRAYLYGNVPPERRREVQRQLEAFGGDIEGEVSWTTLREEDWAEAWKTYYEIEHVGRVVIRPAWRDYEARPEEVVVSLDPGMAFGTGQHPTTRMCLQGMQELLKPGDRVLDLGTGSGILAIAAAHLGAASVIASDIEELAVKAARANLALNDTGNRVEVFAGSLDAVESRAPFNFVLANINATTVIALCGGIRAAMSPGAHLLAGGVIEEREEPCRDALLNAGFEILRVMRDGDWRTFVCRR